MCGICSMCSVMYPALCGVWCMLYMCDICRAMDKICVVYRICVVCVDNVWYVQYVCVWCLYSLVWM